ncbi:MAG: aspartate kinase [Bacillota bacterium]
MGIIVQKYGGTSVRNPEARFALLDHVRRCKEEGNDVVVVVSAMGRKGDAYATDTFIKLLADIHPRIDPKKQDMMTCCGEIISCSLIAHWLESQGIPAEPLTGFQAGIITDDHFSNSDIKHIDTDRVLKYLREGKIVVVAGFQGMTENMEITTLGRGGSDTTAVALGAYLQAERVDIFTDVPGVAVIDPRVVSNAVYHKCISYESMYKLAESGSKVVHAKAVQIAQKHHIPVRVRSTFSDDMGTLIDPDGYKIEKNKKIIGISLQKEITYIKIDKKELIHFHCIKEPYALYRDQDKYIEIYCKDSSKIIEFYGNKYYELACHKNFSQVSIFFHARYKGSLQTDLKELITSSNIMLHDSFWFEDAVMLLVPSENAVDYANQFYRYLEAKSYIL